MNSQSEINDDEWKKNENWSMPIGFYFSKKDSRWIVPKRNKLMGWTFNIGNKTGSIATLISFIVPIFLLTFVFILLTIKSVGK